MNILVLGVLGLAAAAGFLVAYWYVGRVELLDGELELLEQRERKAIE